MESICEQTTAVILAGGLGTRLGGVSGDAPKPMVEVGGVPLLLRIMDNYARSGVRKFIVLAGFRANKIKEFFSNYHLFSSDVTFSLQDGAMRVLSQDRFRDYEVTVLDTGLETMTGGRLLRARHLLNDGDFFLTYGDGLADIDFDSQLRFHRGHGKVATVTAVNPQSKFGHLELLPSGAVSKFSEKPTTTNQLISGGFFVFSSGIFNYLSSDSDTLEESPLQSVAGDGQLMAYVHSHFWFCMDTPKDFSTLQALLPKPDSDIPRHP